ncbi:unnamed protein product, partial [Porites lobata]
SLRFPCRKVSRLMYRLYSESRQEPRSEDQGTRRNVKELHYTSIKVKGRFDGGSKGGKCRYLNFLSRKNRSSIEEADKYAMPLLTDNFFSQKNVQRIAKEKHKFINSN